MVRSRILRGRKSCVILETRPRTTTSRSRSNRVAFESDLSGMTPLSRTSIRITRVVAPSTVSGSHQSAVRIMAASGSATCGRALPIPSTARSSSRGRRYTRIRSVTAGSALGVTPLRCGSCTVSCAASFALAALPVVRMGPAVRWNGRIPFRIFFSACSQY